MQRTLKNSKIRKQLNKKNRLRNRLAIAPKKIHRPKKWSISLLLVIEELRNQHTPNTLAMTLQNGKVEVKVNY